MPVDTHPLSYTPTPTSHMGTGSTLREGYISDFMMGRKEKKYLVKKSKFQSFTDFLSIQTRGKEGIRQRELRRRSVPHCLCMTHTHTHIRCTCSGTAALNTWQCCRCSGAPGSRAGCGRSARSETGERRNLKLRNTTTGAAKSQVCPQHRSRQTNIFA